MDDESETLERERAMVQAQLPEARRWITHAIGEAEAAGLSQETISATLFMEALGRMGMRHGSEGLASILSHVASNFAGLSKFLPSIN